LAVSYQNCPRGKLREVSKHLPKALLDRRGALCTIVSGIGKEDSRRDQG
jgi:hypothetical protein